MEAVEVASPDDGGSPKLLLREVDQLLGDGKGYRPDELVELFRELREAL